MNIEKNDAWDPVQYRKFQEVRDKPFFDLLHMIHKTEDMHVVDLGCGTGELTKLLHQHLNAINTLGVDSSQKMLKEAVEEPGLSFILKDIEKFHPNEKYDLIVSNSCLHWLSDHPILIKRLSTYLTSSGQLAIQIPANFIFPTHMIASEIAAENHFKSLGVVGFKPAMLMPEEYSTLFYQLGFRFQQVRLQIYPMLFSSIDELIEWVKGTLLTYYRRQLQPDDYNEFFIEYSQRMRAWGRTQKSLFIPYKRLLLWAKKT